MSRSKFSDLDCRLVVDWLYVNLANQIRGLNIHFNNVRWMITVNKHLGSGANPCAQAVVCQEQEKLLRVAEEFANALDITTDLKKVSQSTKITIKKNN